jgi:hypothetical protein
VRWASSAAARRGAARWFRTPASMWFLFDDAWRAAAVETAVFFMARRARDCLYALVNTRRSPVDGVTGTALTELCTVTVADADAQCAFDVLWAVLRLYGLQPTPAMLQFRDTVVGCIRAHGMTAVETLRAPADRPV